VSATRPTSARKTLSWGLLDQIVASASTFMFIVLGATSVSARELGAMAFVFELYLLSVFVARGVAGDPLTSRFSGTDDAKLSNAVRSATTTTLVVGVGIGVLLAAASLFAEPPLRGVLLVGAVAMPGLTLQDFVRSALIVQGRVRSTFLNDTFWAVGQVPAMLLAIAIHPTAPVVFGGWAVMGCVAALVGLFQLKCGIARPRAVREWLHETRDIWPYYLGDNMVFQLTSLLLTVVVSSTAGLTATAGFRVAMTVYAPLSLIGRGVITVAVAMLAPRRDNPAEVRRSALTISTILTPLAIGWGLLTFLVPTAAGEALFGDSWLAAKPVVFLASFVCASGLFATGVVIGLRALSAGRHTLAGRLTVSIGASIAGATGGILGAQHGLFLALAIFFPVQVVVWSTLLNHATRQAERKIESGASLDVE
jgi:O-antigen/teichoic acid export membrane protein